MLYHSGCGHEVCVELPKVVTVLGEISFDPVNHLTLVTHLSIQSNLKRAPKILDRKLFCKGCGEENISITNCFVRCYRCGVSIPIGNANISSYSNAIYCDTHRKFFAENEPTIPISEVLANLRLMPARGE